MRLMKPVSLLILGCAGGVLAWRNREFVQHKISSFRQSQQRNWEHITSQGPEQTASPATGTSATAFPMPEEELFNSPTEPMPTITGMDEGHEQRPEGNREYAGETPLPTMGAMENAGESTIQHEEAAGGASLSERIMRRAAQDMPPQFDDAGPGHLGTYADDETINDRVLTNVGRFLRDAGLPHININTQSNGVVYLRGPVRSEDQRSQIEQIARQTEGVRNVVNEIEVQQELGEVQ